MFEINNVFYEITAILLLSAVISTIGAKLKMPLIVSFIVVGILVGPSVLGIVSQDENIELLAKIGIAILLFVVGLKLDWHLIKTIGPVAIAAGVGQVIFTSSISYVLALMLGLGFLPALYLAFSLTFASTIIVVKLLSDKREIDSLYGRIALGSQIILDICAIFFMIILTAVGSGPGEKDLATFFISEFGRLFIYGGLFLGFLWVMVRYVLPRFVSALAKNTELLILFAITWAITLAAIVDSLGFSLEVGAFMAGLALASSPFRDAIGARLTTLRDFLLLFFFINLGSSLYLDVIGEQLLSAIIFSSIVLIGKPLIVMAVMGYMGYRKRTSFLVGVAIGQISEFSLIVAALGITLGHLDNSEAGLITLIGLITIGVNTYMIIYSNSLFKFFSPYLSIFERKIPYREEDESSEKFDQVDVILFGLGTYGGNIARKLLKRDKKVVGVDFDPQVLRYWKGKEMPVVYGDAEDPELLDHLPIRKADWAVCVLPDRNANLALVELLHQSGFSGRIVTAARSQSDADLLENSKADIILKPFAEAAESAVDSLTTAMHSLPDKMIWPASIREIPMKSGSVYSGKKIGEIPLRKETGASILAITRAGKSIFDPGPDFQLFPGDRLVLLGEEESLIKAVEFMDQSDTTADEDEENFTIAPMTMREGCPWIGKTLASVNFKRDFGVTVIGIERGDQQINAPKATEVIEPEDRLIFAGKREAVNKVQMKILDSQTDDHSEFNI